MTIDKGELTMEKQIINPNPLKRGNNRVMEIDPNLVETGCRYNVICEYIYCIDASDLFQMIPPPGGSKKLSDIQVAQASLKDKHTTSLFSLQPNPARGARKTFRHLFLGKNILGYVSACSSILD